MYGFLSYNVGSISNPFGLSNQKIPMDQIPIPVKLQCEEKYKKSQEFSEYLYQL